MSLTFTPNGLSYADYVGGKPRYSAFRFPLQSSPGDSTPLFNIGQGDVVALSGGFICNATAATAYPPAATTQLILGVFNAVNYQPSQQGNQPGSFKYWVAGTTTANTEDAMVSVAMDPDQIYIVQADGPVAQSSIGGNFNLGGFANTTGAGQSGIYMDNTPLATTANWGQVKLLGLAPTTPAIPVNDWGDSYTWVKVKLNSTVLQFGQYGVA